ncbi:alpha-N-arabinofuranosidase [Paenibacillus sp. FSL A5-0031]|uniref:glycoside hydrolase family 43 protein n=1 Tax=Paenibacillus sp. FSL A5-0031 TaxID=1920420 RepID=UPI00096CE9A0|nr:glycoside hydrolase family 43 protein [Paenibacillus sp. FSL A5-0031]OME87819.1 alpha-N-arabinofuranosidase [Paenibacillus sp. FSL A5-0031]
MSKTFVNPLLVHGADPWMYKHVDGTYYFMVTRRNRLDLWRSDNITNIANGDKKTIWIPEETGINSNNLWAPEIHYINKKWYVYYTANDGGGDSTRKIFVLENEEDDPFEGTWTDKGFINTEYAGLDGTVFEHMGRLFFLYAGYGHFPEYGSAIYMAKMINPWTIEGENVLLSAPTDAWEMQGGMAINEGPVILKNNGKIFLVFSASTCWSDDYSLGLLTCSEQDDLMNPKSWIKTESPVFQKSLENEVFGPGHNSFVKSPDGKEDWIIYHAISVSGAGSAHRSTRAQKFGWDEQGKPDFGIPVPIDQPIDVPSGE